MVRRFSADLYRLENKIKRPRFKTRALLQYRYLYCTCDFAAAEAPCAGVDAGWSPVHHGLDTLYVGFPSAVAAPVGVAHLYSKSDVLIAILTLSHLLHLLACIRFFVNSEVNNRCKGLAKMPQFV